MNKFQMQLYYYKKKLGLTNEDIAKRTNLSKETISRICKGTTKDPKAETLRVIAKAFNITVDELIGTEDNVQPYFFNAQTAKIAEDIKNNADLLLLFETLKDLSSEELKTILGIVNMIKNK
mgnify:CR=1 FL=1